MSVSALTFCGLCNKKTEFHQVHQPDGSIISECGVIHFRCKKCGAGYSNPDHFKAHHSTHDIESTWKNISFEHSTNPQNFLDSQQYEIEQEEKYAKQGIMYGSAVWTDFVCACDGLERAFNGDIEGYESPFEGLLSVEDALSQCAVMGYDMEFFGYYVSASENRARKKYAHANGWACHWACKVCDK